MLSERTGLPGVLTAFWFRFVTGLAAAALIAGASSSFASDGGIHDAVLAGNLGKVKALLKKNPALAFEKDSSDQTPLHLAVEVGRKDIAELLLANKADVNAADSESATPLYLA